MRITDFVKDVFLLCLRHVLGIRMQILAPSFTAYNSLSLHSLSKASLGYV